jgi:uncharacterized protein YjbI with pentapeptide repeats
MDSDAPIDILRKLGVAGWNEWRKSNPTRNVNLRRQSLFGYFGPDPGLAAGRIRSPLKKGHVTNLAGINLSNADLTDAFIESANLDGADLTGAILDGANLTDANLSNARLNGAILRDARLRRASLMNAELRQADLMYTQLNGADLSGADLTGANVYGVAAWNVKISDQTKQSNLRLQNYNEPALIVDSLQVAQFIHLLVHNQSIRDVIRTVTSKVVLILGRFTPPRKEILDALREELRRPEYGYVPIVFDFAAAEDRDITETVTLLARMARFVIADLTDPASIPQELQAIAPDIRVPIRSIIEQGQPYSMSHDLLKYPWVVRPIYRYENKTLLLAKLKDEIIDVTEAKLREIANLRAEESW